MNHHIRTVIVAPMTSVTRGSPTRVPVTFQGKKGQIVLDQIRTVDKTRLVKKLGKIEAGTRKKVTRTLLELFAE